MPLCQYLSDSRGASTKTRIETRYYACSGCDQGDSRGASTKTRIETGIGKACLQFREWIQEAHPLKQGLKPCMSVAFALIAANSRGASTKTRIETKTQICNLGGSLDSRGASTKTRIETGIGKACLQFREWIQEAHPLKQGLKQRPGRAARKGGCEFKRRIH